LVNNSLGHRFGCRNGSAWQEMKPKTLTSIFAPQVWRFCPGDQCQAASAQTLLGCLEKRLDGPATAIFFTTSTGDRVRSGSKRRSRGGFGPPPVLGPGGQKFKSPHLHHIPQLLRPDHLLIPCPLSGATNSTCNLLINLIYFNRKPKTENRKRYYSWKQGRASRTREKR